MHPRLTFMTLLAALLMPAWIPATAEDGPVDIHKVKYEKVDLDEKVDTDDPMIRFERRYLLYGAVTSEELRERAGHYYTVFWKAKDRVPGAVVRFEYIQGRTGAKEIKVQEKAVDVTKRKNVTKFQVTGEEYAKDGNVLAWRTSVVRDGRVLDSVESFLWD